MAAPDDAEMYELVREGIAAIIGGAQEYEIRGRRYVRAQLQELWDLENKLKQRISRASTGRSRNYVRLRRPS